MGFKKEQITDEDKLLRRVDFLNPNFIKPNGVPASSSFSTKRNEQGLSVDVERLTTYKKSIQNIKRFRLYALNASYTTSLGLKNIHDPLEDNYAHALIVGNITRSIARDLARHAMRINY